LRVLKRRVSTFESKFEKVTSGCIKPHNKQFRDFESKTNTIRVIK